MGGLSGQATFDAWVRFTPAYLKALHTARYLTVLLWAAVAATGIYYANDALGAITSDISVVAGRAMPRYMREALSAADDLKANFPHLAGEKAIIRVRRLDGEFVLSERTERFVDAMVDSVAAFEPAGMLLGVDSIYSYWKPTWMSSHPPQFIKELFLIDGDSSMLLVVYLNMSYTTQLERTISAVADMVTLAELQLAGPVAYEAFLGGDLTMRQDLSEAVQADAAFVHSLTLPIAIGLLMLYFRSLRIMLIPLVSISLSICTSILVMYLTSLVLPLHYLVPGLLTCVTLACSVDYSLFFLSRLKDEMQERGTSFERAVEVSTANGGYTILTSGFGLAIGFLGLCFFPIDAVLCTGLASALTIVGILAINLSVTPLMLVCFPEFWKASWSSGDCQSCGLPTFAPELPELLPSPAALSAGKRAAAGGFAGALANLAYEADNGAAQGEEEEEEVAGALWWDAFGWWVVTHKWSFVAVGVLFATVVSPSLINTSYTSSPQTVFPHGYPSMEFARELINSYGEGRIWPYYLTLNARNGTVYSDEFFEEAAGFLQDVNESLARTNVQVQSVIGLMYLNGEYVRWSDLAAMLHFADGDCGARERAQISKEINEASGLLGSSMSLTATQFADILEEREGGGKSGGLREPLVEEEDLDEVAQGMGLFLGRLVRNSAVIADTIEQRPGETLAPTVTALSSAVGKSATQAQQALIVGAKASGAVCLNVVDMLRHYVANNRSTVVIISLLRPYGHEAQDWLLDFNNHLAEMEERNPTITASLSGWGSNYLSLQMYTLSCFPWVIGFTASAISLVLFLSYRSLVIALRSAVTNLFSISFVFGTLSLVYSEAVGVSWLVPVVTFSILIGLNMDYDVFLITGILEAKSEGLGTRAAIVRGMSVNGNVIGVAGIIMGAAFSGLLFSSTMMNQQLSLVMVVGIFFDTVFMQSMLVPAIMTVLGEWNWYPSSYSRDSIRSSRGSAGAARIAYGRAAKADALAKEEAGIVSLAAAGARSESLAHCDSGRGGDGLRASSATVGCSGAQSAANTLEYEAMERGSSQ